MVEVSHIRKRYGKKVVLDDVTFTVSPGECVTIIGKNGSGKSTLLKILAGVIRAESGSFTFFKESIPSVRSRFCGYVPQENPLLEQLSVKDNLFLWGGKNVAKQKQVLEEFQLHKYLQTPVERLSGGMKRRVSIACALMKNPPVLLMDEPTASLDFYYKEHLANWIKSYQRINGCVIMSTHDQQEIMKSDRCLLLENGKITELKKEELTVDTVKKIIYENYTENTEEKI